MACAPAPFGRIGSDSSCPLIGCLSCTNDVLHGQPKYRAENANGLSISHCLLPQRYLTFVFSIFATCDLTKHAATDVYGEPVCVITQ